MGRIRTIKPEFPQSEDMGRVSRDARLCFVLLWTVADDEGRLRGSSRMLASLLFPYDNDAPELIDSWLGELSNRGCVIRYEIAGNHYIQICKWKEHQKIDHPSKSKFPPSDSPREDSREFAKDSETLALDQGPRKGEEGKGNSPIPLKLEINQCNPEPPEGLHELNYGRRFWDDLGIFPDSKMIEIAGGNIKLLARDEQCTMVEAMKRCVSRATEYKRHTGKAVNRWFFTDGHHRASSSTMSELERFKASLEQ